jgi:hypothetical protein
VFRMGGDMLFDCDMRAAETDGGADSSIARVI